MTIDKYRMCTVNGRKAAFHGWYQILTPAIGGSCGGGPVCSIVGIVEYEEGDVIAVNMHSIKFCDGMVKEMWECR